MMANKLNIETLAELFRMVAMLEEIRDDLHRSAMFTDNAIVQIRNKIMSKDALECEDWAEFMDNMHVRCMNSKNARRYEESLASRERAIWDRLLELCGSDELGKEDGDEG